MLTFNDTAVPASDAGVLQLIGALNAAAADAAQFPFSEAVADAANNLRASLTTKQVSVDVTNGGEPSRFKPSKRLLSVAGGIQRAWKAYLEESAKEHKAVEEKIQLRRVGPGGSLATARGELGSAIALADVIPEWLDGESFAKDIAELSRGRLFLLIIPPETLTPEDFPPLQVDHALYTKVLEVGGAEPALRTDEVGMASIFAYEHELQETGDALAEFLRDEQDVLRARGVVPKFRVGRKVESDQADRAVIAGILERLANRKKELAASLGDQLDRVFDVKRGAYWDGCRSAVSNLTRLEETQNVRDTTTGIPPVFLNSCRSDIATLLRRTGESQLEYTQRRWGNEILPEVERELSATQVPIVPLDLLDLPQSEIDRIVEDACEWADPYAGRLPKPVTIVQVLSKSRSMGMQIFMMMTLLTAFAGVVVILVDAVQIFIENLPNMNLVSVADQAMKNAGEIPTRKLIGSGATLTAILLIPIVLVTMRKDKRERVELKSRDLEAAQKDLRKRYEKTSQFFKKRWLDTLCQHLGTELDRIAGELEAHFEAQVAAKREQARRAETSAEMTKKGIDRKLNMSQKLANDVEKKFGKKCKNSKNEIKKLLEKAKLSLLKRPGASSLGSSAAATLAGQQTRTAETAPAAGQTEQKASPKAKMAELKAKMQSLKTKNKTSET